MNYLGQKSTIQRAAVYSRLLIVLAVGAVVLGAVALIPGEKRVVNGLLKDEASGRLRELAAQRIGSDPDAAMLPFLSAQLSAKQWEDPKVLGTILAMVEESEQPPVVFESLQTLDIPSAQKAAIAVALSTKSNEDDRSFSQSLDAYIAKTMPRTPEAVLSAVQAYRRAGKAHQAFDLMHGLANDPDGSELPRDFLLVYKDLAFETEHQKTGYSIAQQVWELAIHTAAPSALESGELDSELDELVAAAQGSGEFSQSCQILEDRLVDNAVLKGALADAASAELSDQQEFRKYGQQLAQFSEWDGRASMAFDAYGRLAILGDLSARKRCLALQPGLFRGEELMRILLHNEAVIEFEELNELAKLAGEAGRMGDAKRVYQRLMEVSPEDSANYQVTLGLLLDENGETAAAMTQLTEAFAAQSSASTGAALGRMLVASGEFQTALDHYSAMPVHDRQSAAAFFHLATAMGDKSGSIRALKLQIENTDTPIVSDYVELADANSVSGLFLEAEKVFKEGLERYPLSRELTLRYVAMLGTIGRQSEALNILLGKLEYAVDPAAVARLLELQIGEADYDRVLQWLGGEGVEHRLILAEDGKAVVAGIYLHKGRKKSAMALIQQLPKEPRFAWLRAHVLFINGRYLEAEKAQQDYLAGAGRTMPEAWRQMARIQRALGRGRAARESLAMALSILNNGLIASRVTKRVSDDHNGE